jgi:hypothetical protein
MHKVRVSAFALACSLNVSCREQCQADRKWCEGDVVVECLRLGSDVSPSRNEEVKRGNCGAVNLACVEYKDDAWCGFGEDVVCDESNKGSCQDNWRLWCNAAGSPVEVKEDCQSGGRQLACAIAPDDMQQTRCAQTP